MLYFFYDPLSNNTDSLKTLLVNFIPDDATKENGENNVWTGKLVEWRMNNDEVQYQNLHKSYVTSKGQVQMKDMSNLSIHRPDVKTNALKTNNFLADLWDALKWFVEAIGYFFGVPGDYNYYTDADLYWCDFLWGLFCGSGNDSGTGGGVGGTGGGTGGSTSGGVGNYSGYWETGGPAYNAVYNGYIPGYNGSTPTTWEPYPTDPCGPSPVNVSGIRVNLYNDGGCPTNPLPPPIPVPVDPYPYQLIYNLSTSNEIENEDLEENGYLNKGIHENEALYKDLPAQTRPSYSAFFAAYPKGPTGGDMNYLDVKDMVGGDVKDMYDMNGYKNACALRVSIALNACGVYIPNIPGHTFRGADGKYYFLSSTKLAHFLVHTFPNPDVDLDGTKGGLGGQGYKVAFLGKKGIFIMLAKSFSDYQAYGHCSSFDGDNCVGGATHTPFNPKGGVREIFLWKLQE